MRISIITATKNNKAGLMRTIECVRKQTYKNVEHIIVDGVSTDGTKELMEDGKWKIDNVKFVSEPDEGIYDAINKGIKLATGDVIGLLHSDDLYADEKVLERYAEAFKQPFDYAKGDILRLAQDDRIDAVYSDLLYVKFRRELGREKLVDSELNTTDNQLPTTNYSILRNWKSGDPSTPLKMTQWLSKGWMPPHPTLFVRKEVFEKYGFYRTDLSIASDYEMILRLLYKNKITVHYLPHTTYVMSLGGASNKSIKNILKKSTEDFRAMKLNGMSHPLVTLISKNIRKLPQFLVRSS